MGLPTEASRCRPTASTVLTGPPKASLWHLILASRRRRTRSTRTTPATRRSRCMLRTLARWRVRGRVCSNTLPSQNAYAHGHPGGCARCPIVLCGTVGFAAAFGTAVVVSFWIPCLTACSGLRDHCRALLRDEDTQALVRPLMGDPRTACELIGYRRRRHDECADRDSVTRIGREFGRYWLRP